MMTASILRAYAEQGYSQVQVCRELGISPAGVSQFAKRHGIKFRHATWARTTDERADEMAHLYRAGATLQAIGDRYGITRERVRQLMTRFHAIRRKDGGKHIQSEKRREERRARKEAECLRRHGCTVEQKLSLSGPPLRAYTQQKKSAAYRGIAWEFLLWQWWTVWQESGHWLERGRGRGYCMCRKGDTGPYAIGNIYFAPSRVNSFEGIKHRKKSGLPIGVRERKNGFFAVLTVERKRHNLGPFPTVSQAAAAYWSLAA